MTKINQFFAEVMGIYTNCEISNEARKWFAANEPDVWKKYCLYCLQEIPVNEIFDRWISIKNFYDYLVKHFESWGYEECPVCNGDGSYETMDSHGYELLCSTCNGTGRICKYPEAEKILRGEK
jgi:RecJ-like exonuclease